jgi:soluble cytochrome b562
MRRRRLHPVELAFHLAPFIVLALIAATGAGCGTTPTQQAYTARLTFNGAGHEAIDLRQQGKFPDPGFGYFVTGMKSFAPQLDELDTAADAAEADKTNIAAKYHFSTATLLAKRKGTPSTQPGAH